MHLLSVKIYRFGAFFLMCLIWK